jgi:hypothetical protein
MSPRHVVAVSDSDDDVVEEMHYVRKTSRRMKAAKKQVSEAKIKTRRPQPEAVEASQSRSKAKGKARVQENDPQDVCNERDVDNHEYVEDDEDDILDPLVDEVPVQPQAKKVRMHIPSYSLTDGS